MKVYTSVDGVLVIMGIIHLVVSVSTLTTHSSIGRLFLLTFRNYAFETYLLFHKRTKICKTCHGELFIWLL
jgi:hypothetical protein